jgi:hypothetical protein
MSFTANHVWALAVAADRINGGYVKEDVFDFEVDQRSPVKMANKKMVKQWLRENVNPTTESDTAAGEQCRSYFKTFLMRELAGKISEFERTALKIAQKDEFTSRDMYDFAVISCLPSVMLRDQQRQEIRREMFTAEQLEGEPGDQIVGSINVISSSWSVNYGKWIVKARMGESFVDFWFKEQLQGEVRVKAKIKQHRGDKTTQLNFVKIIG